MGIGVEPFWNAVRHGRSGVRRLTAFDPSSFPCEIAAEVQKFRPEDFLDTRAAGRMGRHSQCAVAAAITAALHDAGAVELAATALSIAHKVVHPTVNLESPDPDCDLDYVPGGGRELEIRCAISNSSGFGGQNSVLVVRPSD